MYTILVTEENELVPTITERIMQRSKLVDRLHFLVEPVYKDQEMADFTVMLEYMLPVSHKYRTELLQAAPDLYKDRLEYKLPFDTALTQEAGDVEMQLTFTCVKMDEAGQATQYVRKTSTVIVPIVSIAAWSDVIADEALTALDQRLIQTDAMIQALNDIGEVLYREKADSLVYENKKLQLTSLGKRIGDLVDLDVSNAEDPDGSLRVVEF